MRTEYRLYSFRDSPDNSGKTSVSDANTVATEKGNRAVVNVVAYARRAWLKVAETRW